MQCNVVPFAKIYTCPALFALKGQGCKNIYNILLKPGMPYKMEKAGELHHMTSILCHILQGLGGLVPVTKEHPVTFNIGISSKSFVTSITLKGFFAALRRGNSAGTCLRNKRALSPPNLHGLHIYNSTIQI